MFRTQPPIFPISLKHALTANSYQVCHSEETAKLVKNVIDRQDKIIESFYKLEEILVRAHVEAKKAWSHGNSFHAPVEISRIIAAGIDKAQEARIEIARVLASLNYNKEVP
jgi:nitrite reductase (cytochrome c-552)